MEERFSKDVMFIDEKIVISYKNREFHTKTSSLSGKVMLYFLKHPGEVFTRDDIRESLHKDKNYNPAGAIRTAQLRFNLSEHYKSIVIGTRNPRYGILKL